MKHPKRLKSQLIIYFTALTFVSSLIISLFLYTNSAKNMEDNMVNNANGTINYIMDNVDKQLKLAEQLTDWTFINTAVNSNLERLLLRDADTENIQLYSDMWAMQDILSNQLANFAVGKYVSSIIIEGNNGVDLRWGIDASTIEKKTMIEQDWFKILLNTSGKIYWYGLVVNPAKYTFDDQVFPIVRPIIQHYLNTKVG